MEVNVKKILDEIKVLDLSRNPIFNIESFYLT